MLRSEAEVSQTNSFESAKNKTKAAQRNKLYSFLNKQNNPPTLSQEPEMKKLTKTSQ